MTETDNSMKKRRAKNFLDEEKEFLTQLVKPYKYIVDSTKTDHATSNLKQTAWQEITEQFNLHSKTGQRSIKQVKELYGNIQKRERRRLRIAANKEGEGIFVYDNDDHSEDNFSRVLNESVSYENLSHHEDFKPSINGQDCISLVDDHDPLNSNTETNNIKIERILPSTNVLAKEQAEKNDRNNMIHIKRVSRDYSEQLFLLKKQKHEKKLEILEIIRKREQVELEIKEVELEIKKKKLLNKRN